MTDIDFKKLQDIIAEIDTLINLRITASAPEFQAWKSKATRFIIRVYGKNSYEHEEFNKIHFSLNLFFGNTPTSEFVNACINGLKKAKAIFLTYLDDYGINTAAAPVAPSALDTPILSKKIFIVHGHDNSIKEAVARVIEKQSIKAIILHEQEAPGATIIEKIEEYSDVGAAVCLFTPDDIGRETNETVEKKRARQNVVFETGYFIGKLGRNNVVLIASNDMEMPSDLQGVLYTDKTEWQVSLLRALKKIGFNIDLNLLDD